MSLLDPVAPTPTAANSAPPPDPLTVPPPGPLVRDRRSPRLRPVKAVLAAGALAGLGWGGWTWGLPGHHKADDVLTATATVGELVITVGDKGELESAKSVQVLCEVEGGGKLVTIVPEGTRVKKGDEVARFDTDALLKGVNEQEVKWEQAEGKMKAAEAELEVQKNKAESEIAKADLALTLAQIDYESYEEGEYQVELDKRRGAVELGKKELKEAEDGLDFTRGLVKKGFAQMEQIRVLELTVESKRYTVRQAEADLRLLEKFTKVRKLTELKAKAEDARRELERTKKGQAAATEKAETELRAARKTADLEKKQLARLRAQLEKCVVKAPQDGIVIYFKRPWDDSSRIKPGAQVFFQQPIFTLPDLDQMKVKLKVHESVVKRVTKGQPATMQVDALRGQVLHGQVLSVATLAAGDDWRGNGVKEYETMVSVDDMPPDAGLRPGMSANVKVLIKTVPGALTVPVQAVTESDGQQVCYVVTALGVERREVTIGEGNEQLVQVTGGLAEGERVALDARSRAAAELKAKGGVKQEEKPEAPPKQAPPGGGGR